MPSIKVVAADGAPETVAEIAGRSPAVEELVGRSAAAESRATPIMGGEFKVGDVQVHHVPKGLSAPNPLSSGLDAHSLSINWGGPPPNGFSEAARQAMRKALSAAADIIKE
jgi:hypothetical protein